jgi:hypothetical protein
MFDIDVLLQRALSLFLQAKVTLSQVQSSELSSIHKAHPRTFACTVHLFGWRELTRVFEPCYFSVRLSLDDISVVDPYSLALTCSAGGVASPQFPDDFPTASQSPEREHYSKFGVCSSFTAIYGGDLPWLAAA